MVAGCEPISIRFTGLLISSIAVEELSSACTFRIIDVANFWKANRVS